METQPPRDTTALRYLTEQLAEMQADLAAIKRLLLDPTLTPEQYASYISSVKLDFVTRNKFEPEMPTTQPIPLRQPNPGLLKPGRRPQQKFKHHCLVCDGEWIANEPEPPSCCYCRSTIWRTGETKWALRRKSQEAGATAVA